MNALGLVSASDSMSIIARVKKRFCFFFKALIVMSSVVSHLLTYVMYMFVYAKYAQIVVGLEMERYATILSCCPPGDYVLLEKTGF